MPVLSGIYDSAPIQPVAKIKENLAIWSGGRWGFYQIEHQDSIAPGPASTVDMVMQAGVTTIAANGTIQKRLVTILLLNDYELLHVRFEPLDNVEGIVWELAGQQKMSSRNIHSRVDRQTRELDPYLSSTTLFILGSKKDVNLECRNPNAYALPAARFVFWGDRNIISDIDLSQVPSPIKARLAMGDVKAVRDVIGPVTWVTAEGRQG